MALIQPAEQSLCVALLYVTLPDQYQGASSAELTGLAEAAHCQVATVYTLKQKRPYSKLFIGKGHVEALKQVCLEHTVTHVLVNHDLSASCQKHLSEALCVDVIDRTELILHIFALHARSFAGKLQVELAQLTRLSTRLIRGWTHLERQKGGIGLRGPGETQLETDRRLITRRIKTIRKKLDAVRSQRQQTSHAGRQSKYPTAVLVGYTNSGKSTLFNALTAANVLCAGYPFATLDPVTRRMEVPGLEGVLLIDTVGFIRGLPPAIIEAFHATLDAVHEADVLIHVVDVAEVVNRGHVAACADVKEVLTQLEADHLPTVMVYNKKDLICASDVGYESDVCCVSALQCDGLDRLKETIGRRISEAYCQRVVLIPFDQAQPRALCYERGWVLSAQETDAGWLLTIQAPRADLLAHLNPYFIE
jgi:GTPase